jgi:hypothetical protein
MSSFIEFAGTYLKPDHVCTVTFTPVSAGIRVAIAFVNGDADLSVVVSAEKAEHLAKMLGLRG